ncbi:MAG: hypothetical protein U5K79_12745 [Cyclobacteriaceae bacterium]|nr:hypothetical protein [Cyclobacteriaceae bacterium]
MENFLKDPIGKQILAASHYKLDNLVAIIDYNKLQITGPTSAVCNTDPVDEKFKAFGWAVEHVDGHDFRAMIDVFSVIPFAKDKPSLVIAHTIKGKGISYMEGQKKWHHGAPDDDQYSLAQQELDTKMKDYVALGF